MASRDDFLQDLKSGDPRKFLNYVIRDSTKDDVFNFKEIIQSLPRKKHSEVWESILSICGNVFSKIDLLEDIDENPLECDAQDILESIWGIAKFALSAISVDDCIIPNELLQVCLVLHGILLSLPEQGGKIQYEISLLCETWYLQGINGGEQLVTNNLPFLLARTHTNNATDGDFKRLWNMREAFWLLDYDHESSESIKNLVLQCYFHPSYYQVTEGKQLLSFFFGVDVKFSMEIHKLIKNQMPTLPQHKVDVIAELYFKAWHNHSGSLKEQLEELIQDFMYHTVHAKRSGGSNSLASKLRKVLSYFHGKKREPGVDEMLYRLYQPILWRSLKAANPLVRMNAVSVLVDAFPLEDPSASNAENDEIIQKQFDTFAEMLLDPFPSVRAEVILGFCKICGVFGEWIPAETTNDLISKLVSDLAYDTSSAEVRCAVFQGLKTLLEYHLSHQYLKRLLPELKNSIHDVSPKVRGAFLDLLLLLKSARALKFWKVVPFDHLLIRLEFDSSTSCIKNIVKLLLNFYLPVDKGPKDQVKGCLSLLQWNKASARKFYQCVGTILPQSAIKKFLFYLTTYIAECCHRGVGSTNNPNNNNANGDGNEEEVNDDEGFEEDKSLEEQELQEAEADDTTVSGMIDILALLIVIAQRRFKKEAIVRGKLLDKLSKALPDFLASFENIEVKTAVMIIAKEMPVDSIPSISESCLSSFKKLSSVVGPEEYGPILQCLCQWGHCSGVLQHINTLLKEFMNRETERGILNKKRKRDVQDYKPELALHYLSWLLVHFKSSVTACEDELFSLLQTLKESLVQIGEGLEAGNGKQEEYGILHCLSECFGQFFRLDIHSLIKNAPQLETEDIDKALVDIMQAMFTWIDKKPYLNNSRFLSLSEFENEYRKKGKQKLRMEEEPSRGDKSLILFKILNDSLKLVSDTILIGLGSVHLNTTSAHWIEHLLDYDFAIPLIPQMIGICFQIAQDPRSKYNSHDHKNDPEEDAMLRILRKAASTLSLASHNDKFTNEIGQILLASKLPFAEILRFSHISGEEDGYDRAVMATITKEIIFDVKRTIAKQADEEVDCNIQLPPLSMTICGILLKSLEMKKTFMSAVKQNLTEFENDADALLAALVIMQDLNKRGNNTFIKAKIKTCGSRIIQIMENLVSSDSEKVAIERKKTVGNRIIEKLCNDNGQFVR